MTQGRNVFFFCVLCAVAKNLQNGECTVAHTLANLDTQPFRFDIKV